MNTKMAMSKPRTGMSTGAAMVTGMEGTGGSLTSIVRTTHYEPTIPP